MQKLALELGNEDIFEQRCRAYRKGVCVGGVGMRREGLTQTFHECLGGERRKGIKQMV